MSNYAPVDYTDTHPSFADEEPLRTSSDEVAAVLQKAISEGRLRRDNEWDEDLRLFVAPLEPMSRFLVHAGKKIIGVNSWHDPQGSLATRDMSRESEEDGDVWAQFAGGICATRDPIVIEWCLAHSGDEALHVEYHSKRDEELHLKRGTSARECGVDWGLCRDADWEATPSWAEMKQLQSATSRRSAQLPVSLDLNKMFDRLMPNLGRTEESDRLAESIRSSRNADREQRRAF